MPLGPDKLSPIGIEKKRRLETLLCNIDYYIRTSEDNTIILGSHSFSAKYLDLKEEISILYKNAGWLHVYWKTYYSNKGYFRDRLILSNDINHVK